MNVELEPPKPTHRVFVRYRTDKLGDWRTLDVERPGYIPISGREPQETSAYIMSVMKELGITWSEVAQAYVTIPGPQYKPKDGSGERKP